MKPFPLLLAPLAAAGLGDAVYGVHQNTLQCTRLEAGRFALPVPPGPQQPTLANGRLYVRGARHVVCYQLAEAP
jgi:hypothetical protein